jgi:hypothetical protein
MEVEVNYWAVLLAGASSMVVGSIWYAKSVFGNSWTKLAKVDKNKPYSMVVALGLTFIASLVTAYILAHVTYLSNQFFNNSFFQDAMTTAFWLWLGFTVARMLTHDLFEGRPWKLIVMNAAHELVTILVMGLIIGLMGV